MCQTTPMRRSPVAPPGLRPASYRPPPRRLTGLPLQRRRPQGLADRNPHGVELVIAGHLLDQRPAAVVLEYDEVADERGKPVRRTDALEHHLELGHVRVRQGLARDRPPRLEPLPPGGERPDARLDPVRDHEHRVHGEERRQLGLVGLQLLPRRPDGGVLVYRVLELDDAQGQAVDEQHDVGAAGVLVLRDSELVDRQPVVGGGIVEVDDSRLRPAHRAAVRAVLHGHAVDQHPVEGAVARLERRPLRPRQLAKGVVQRLGGQTGVQLAEGVPQPPLQHDLPVVTTLGARRIRRDVRPVHDLPADIAQPVEGRFLNVGFGDGHGVSQGLTILTSNPPKSLTLRVATDRSFAFAVPAMRASASCNAQPSRCARAWNVAAHSAS